VRFGRYAAYIPGIGGSGPASDELTKLADAEVETIRAYPPAS